MSTGQKSDKDPQPSNQTTPAPVVSVSTTQEPTVSPQPPAKPREGAHRFLGTEPAHEKRHPTSPTGHEKTTASNKHQVRNVERTSDLQREIPRLLEQKRQTLLAQKAFFVNEAYDEWQDTFISTDDAPLPPELFADNPEDLHELEQPTTQHHGLVVTSDEDSSMAAFFAEQDLSTQDLSSPSYPALPEIPPSNLSVPTETSHTVSEAVSDITNPNAPAAAHTSTTTDDLPHTSESPSTQTSTNEENNNMEETVSTRHEDMDIPDILDIGDVKSSDDHLHDTVIFKK